MSATPLRVSVVTVTLNNRAYVGDTIRSVLAQTYPAIEYVVVDGGSSVGRVPSGPGAARASGAAGPVAGRAGGPVPVGRPTSAIPSSSAASAPATAANAVPVRRLVSMPPGR